MICYIPSKGRPSTKTHKLFQSAGIEVLHFIEPSEYELYHPLPGTKVNIGEDNRGISYVRNFMLDYAKRHGHIHVIFCDDDVTSFGKYVDGERIKSDASIWLEIFDKVRDLPYELVGINYVQFAWGKQKDMSINTKFAEVCVLINNTSKIHWGYRAEFDTKEDRDFVMQTIRDGAGVLRFNQFWFACPGVGTNRGGLQNLYKEKRDELAAHSMCEEWAPYITTKQKGNRLDLKADLKGLALHYGKESFFR
jgi:hypothetical protein